MYILLQVSATKGESIQGVLQPLPMVVEVKFQWILAIDAGNYKYASSNGEQIDS